MKIYKEQQYLIFDFENGKTVKYDFAKKQAIGKTGKPVKDLKTQLSGWSLDELFECCDNKQYAKFLRFVMNQENQLKHVNITNIGTILERVPFYSNYEQIFSAGIEDIISNSCNGRFKYKTNDIPKAMIKICRNHEVKISNCLVREWKLNPDAYYLAYNLEYDVLTDKDITDILTRSGTFLIKS